MVRLKTITFGILLLVLILLIPHAYEFYNQITIYNFVANNMRGVEVKFEEFKGNVILIVNTATECRYTPQFIGLQKLYDTYKNKGFIVIAFPSNSFQQEPRSTQEIVRYCSSKYLVDFPIFEKIDLNGQYQASIYKYLTEEKTNKNYGGPIKGNFEKFVIGKTGKVIGRFDPEISPEDPVLIQCIEDALSDDG